MNLLAVHRVLAEDATAEVAVAKSADEYHSSCLTKSVEQRYQEAIEDCSKAIALDPKPFYYYSRALAYKYFEDFMSALYDVNTALELKPDGKFKSAYELRCEIYRRLLEPASALADCNKVLELRPKDSHAHSERGFVNIMLKDYKAALTDFGKAIKLDSNNAQAYLGRGVAKVEGRRGKHSGCLDMKKAGEMGELQATMAILTYCR